MLEEILNDHFFNPALMANMIITSYPPHTQEKLIELMKYIYTYNKLEIQLDNKLAAGRYKNNNPQIDRPDTSWIQESQYNDTFSK